jgi:hypothetical protein
MLSLKCSVLSVFLKILLVWSFTASAEVVELGSSQLHGKKDQPEAITFVSRAPLNLGDTTSEWKAVDKIKQEITRDIFALSMVKE